MLIVSRVYFNFLKNTDLVQIKKINLKNGSGACERSIGAASNCVSGGKQRGNLGLGSGRTASSRTHISSVYQDSIC